MLLVSGGLAGLLLNGWEVLLVCCMHCCSTRAGCCQWLKWQPAPSLCPSPTQTRSFPTSPCLPAAGWEEMLVVVESSMAGGRKEVALAAIALLSAVLQAHGSM